MKKILAIITVISLMLSMAACDKKADNTDVGASITQGGVAYTENGEEIPGSTIDGAGKEVDMDKVDGVSLKPDEETEKTSKGKIGNYEVSIDEAKIVTTENSKVLVVSFTFTNNSNSPAAFANVFSVDFMQNDTKMMGLPVNVEGVNVNSAVEVIDPGKTTKVQRVRYITDEETPVAVSVYKYADMESGVVSKTFNLK